jgi:hypothetical protein
MVTKIFVGLTLYVKWQALPERIAGTIPRTSTT